MNPGLGRALRSVGSVMTRNTADKNKNLTVLEVLAAAISKAWRDSGKTSSIKKKTIATRFYTKKCHLILKKLKS